MYEMREGLTKSDKLITSLLKVANSWHEWIGQKNFLASLHQFPISCLFCPSFASHLRDQTIRASFVEKKISLAVNVGLPVDESHAGERLELRPEALLGRVVQPLARHPRHHLAHQVGEGVRGGRVGLLLRGRTRGRGGRGRGRGIIS